MNEGIFYLLTPETIGITAQAEIKVYVSPLALVSQGRYRSTKTDVIRSIDEIIKWWNATHESNIKKTGVDKMMSNSLGFSSSELEPDAEKNVISSLIQNQSNRIKELAFPEKMIRL